MKKIEEIREIQTISLHLLETFDDFCKSNHLTYYLAWGTLLGAIRHHGFIPWDDDIDLMMPREDYDRLLKMHAGEISERVRIWQTEKTGDFLNANIRVADENTVVDLSSIENRVGQGIWLTIFPLDRLPDNMHHRKRYLNKISWIYKILLISTLKKDGFQENMNIKGKIAKFLRRYIFGISMGKYLYVRLQKMLREYSNSETSEVGILSIGTGDKTHFSVESFQEKKIVKFEGGNYPIPIGYDEILRNTYGDYMELPPIEQRIPKHDFVAYYIE